MGKIGSLFWEITAETSKFVSGLKTTQTEVSKLKTGVGSAVKELTGFSLSTFAGVGGLVALSNAVRGAVDDTVKYADAVRQMSRISGASADETSRLIQVTDDLGVSQNELQTAMEGAARKGIVLNTESMAKLADEYVALSDPVARNTLLLDNFGKSGLNMAAAMSKGGDAIRQMSAAVDDNLVLTQKQVDAAREYEIALDNVGDAISAVKMQIGNELLPGLTATIQQLMINADMLKKGATLWEIESFNQRLYAMSTDEAAQALKRYLNWDQMAVDTGFIHAQMITGTLNPAIQAQGSTTALAVSEMENIWEASNKATEEGLKYSSAINDLKAATDNLKSAQEGWMSGAGGDVKAELEAAGLKGEDYRKALAAIDTQMGTNFTQEQAYKDNIKLLVDEYARGGDLSKFTGGLASMKTEFMEMNEDVIAARVSVQELQTALDLLTSQSYGVVVSYSQSGGPSYSAGGNGGQRGGEQYANGGSFVIPSGYGYEGFNMGGMATASAGETVTITPAGKSPGNITVNINGVQGVNQINARDIARQLVREMTRG